MRGGLVHPAKPVTYNMRPIAVSPLAASAEHLAEVVPGLKALPPLDLCRLALRLGEVLCVRHLAQVLVACVGGWPRRGVV